MKHAHGITHIHPARATGEHLQAANDQLRAECKRCPLALGYGGEGVGCACSREATVDAYRAISRAVVDGVRAMDIGDWLFVATLLAAAAALAWGR